LIRDPFGFWSNGYNGDMRIYVRAVLYVVDVYIHIDMARRYRPIDGPRLWRGRADIKLISARYRIDNNL